MEKLNLRKEPPIEIFRLIEKKIEKKILSSIFSSKTRIISFTIYFYVGEDGAAGDVYSEEIGHIVK